MASSSRPTCHPGLQRLSLQCGSVVTTVVDGEVQCMYVLKAYFESDGLFKKLVGNAYKDVDMFAPHQLGEGGVRTCIGDDFLEAYPPQGATWCANACGALQQA